MSIQTILALGAMILLTLVIINATRTSIITEDVMYDSNFGILGTSLGTSVIEDATRKAFDQNTDTVALANNEVNKLTPSGSLGPDAGENSSDPKTFNDFDDYHGYTRIDSSMPSAIFNIEASVYYVEGITPGVIVNNQTWHKMITVRVWSKSMRDTIIQKEVFSYWNFR